MDLDSSLTVHWQVSLVSQAGCASVTPIGAIIIGAVAGVAVCPLLLMQSKWLRLTIAVGAFAVHGVCGAVGNNHDWCRWFSRAWRT